MLLSGLPEVCLPPPQPLNLCEGGRRSVSVQLRAAPVQQHDRTREGPWSGGAGERAAEEAQRRAERRGQGVGEEGREWAEWDSGLHDPAGLGASSCCSTADGSAGGCRGSVERRYECIRRELLRCALSCTARVPLCSSWGAPCPVLQPQGASPLTAWLLLLVLVAAPVAGCLYPGRLVAACASCCVCCVTWVLCVCGVCWAWRWAVQEGAERNGAGVRVAVPRQEW